MGRSLKTHRSETHGPSLSCDRFICCWIICTVTIKTESTSNCIIKKHKTFNLGHGGDTEMESHRIEMQRHETRRNNPQS